MPEWLSNSANDKLTSISVVVGLNSAHSNLWEILVNNPNLTLFVLAASVDWNKLP